MLKSSKLFLLLTSIRNKNIIKNAYIEGSIESEVKIKRGVDIITPTNNKLLFIEICDLTF